MAENKDVTRMNYKPLTKDQEDDIKEIKYIANHLICKIQEIFGQYPESKRELDLCIERAEEASMWGVKGVTK